MAINYPIQWLDNFINSTIHPEKNNRETLVRICSEHTARQIKLEVSNIKTKIKNRVFSMRTKPQIQLYIINHYRSFEVLLSQIGFYRQFKVYENSEPLEILNILQCEITELCSFIEIWYTEYLQQASPKRTPPRNDYSKKFKKIILCNLSLDQIAIVLKAADDSKILVARSMRSVFKAITPHLSTPSQKNLSYESLRVRSYAIKKQDKEVAIKYLNLMIKNIEKY